MSAVATTAVPAPILRCATCFFFVRTRRGANGEPDSGECHRGLIGFPEGRCWPLRTADDWCGEYRTATPASDPQPPSAAQSAAKTNLRKRA